jgi:hypothetical protein
MNDFWDYTYWDHVDKNNKQLKKERKDKFKQKFEEFSKDKEEVKCLSDKGLLYLRFGIDKLRNYYGINYVAESEEDGEPFEEYCTRIYNEVIRGNMDFTNKSMVSVASSFLYICCIMKNIDLTQKDIAEIYAITPITIQKNYSEIRKVMKI